MALPLPTPIPTPPEARDDYAGLEELDRPELDDAPDTEPSPTLPTLEWDEEDGESGVKQRR
ncbi:MAG TPA: hypothetical protein VGH28_04355 [Polyangiaceae bacterium]|jgi:hypothetical protein